ncbi:ABC transporter ATP-binding protein [Saccharothrix variisporea]|uniref:ABC-2 type transport system ATP-binding protein n=1 Tax=Saccharothrix variisporea TaxID=543527 RepID=A0A495X726_9PSEU|nr:ABC transporter ATP-binding protein [Saccharothrix variisporea]RKT69276.1 ABC-2 type transport system ATP-binding protein [Saccharothrix variisporea]
MTGVVEAAGLVKRYGDVVAVDGVSLSIGRGEVYALLGLNGAGKTTTIRMLLGMVRPTEGSVRVLGSVVGRGRREVWARVGYLVEEPAAYPELTVVENLRVVAGLRGLRGRREVEEVVSRLGLDAYADRRAGTLSQGNAQRLGLAKALLHRPELLVLDEPANALDPAGVVEVRELLRGLSREHGVTVVLSSHVLAEVARLATRIGVLHEGRLLQDDLAARARPRLRVTTRDPATGAAVLRAAGLEVQEEEGGVTLAQERAVREPDVVATVLVRAGCPPTGLTVEQDDLETVFLRLVGAR